MKLPQTTLHNLTVIKVEDGRYSLGMEAELTGTDQQVQAFVSSLTAAFMAGERGETVVETEPAPVADEKPKRTRARRKAAEPKPNDEKPAVMSALNAEPDEKPKRTRTRKVAEPAADEKPKRQRRTPKKAEYDDDSITDEDLTKAASGMAEKLDKAGVDGAVDVVQQWIGEFEVESVQEIEGNELRKEFLDGIVKIGQEMT